MDSFDLNDELIDNDIDFDAEEDDAALEQELLAQEETDVEMTEEDLETEAPIATIMITGDSHLSSENYGQHLNYPEETLYYEKLLSKIAEEEQVTHYINAGDLVMKKDFNLEYRAKVDQILTERRDMMRQRGGDLIYLRGNHDYSLHNITEYDYYAERDVFTPAAKQPTLDICDSTGTAILHIELKDWKNESDCNNYGQHNMLVAHGLFTADYVTGEKMPNYGTATDLTHKDGWKDLEYIFCGHIHTEHIQQLRISDSAELTTVHYLPCLARPQYIKKYEEGEQARREGSVDLIRVYENGHVYVERYAVDFADNRLCFNIEKINNEAAKIELSLANQSRQEALKNMAEELQQYETRDVDPIEQVKALGNTDEFHKNIVYGWFAEADEQLRKSTK